MTRHTSPNYVVTNLIRRTRDPWNQYALSSKDIRGCMNGTTSLTRRIGHLSAVGIAAQTAR